MKKTIKLAGLLLLLIASATPLLFVFSFPISLHQIKQEARHKLETHPRQVLELESTQFSWIKPGKEILINGRYFDVASFSREGNHWTFHGIFDKEEDSLISLLRSEDKPASGNHPIMNKLVEILSQLYPAPANPQSFSPIAATVYPPLSHTNLTSCYLSVLAPPPRS